MGKKKDKTFKCSFSTGTDDLSGAAEEKESGCAGYEVPLWTSHEHNEALVSIGEERGTAFVLQLFAFLMYINLKSKQQSRICSATPPIERSQNSKQARKRRRRKRKRKKVPSSV